MGSPTDVKKVTLTSREWCVPSVERAFDGWIAGKPSRADRRRVTKGVLKDRASWKPSHEAMLLVEKLKAFVGARVAVQFWDPIMLMLEDEGPLPIVGDCKDVILLQEGEFLQAYLVLENSLESPATNGYLTTRSGVAGLLAPLSDLYEIWKVPGTARKRRSRAIAGSNQAT